KRWSMSQRYERDLAASSSAEESFTRVPRWADVARIETVRSAVSCPVALTHTEKLVLASPVSTLSEKLDGSISPNESAEKKPVPKRPKWTPAGLSVAKGTSSLERITARLIPPPLSATVTLCSSTSTVTTRHEGSAEAASTALRTSSTSGRSGWPNCRA